MVTPRYISTPYDNYVHLDLLLPPFHLGNRFLRQIGRMFLKQLDLTTALRPAYLPDEVLLFVQDNVGLYEGSVVSLHLPSF